MLCSYVSPSAVIIQKHDTSKHIMKYGNLLLLRPVLLVVGRSRRAFKNTSQTLGVMSEVGVSSTTCITLLLHFSICECHPCAGAMLTFSVSFRSTCITSISSMSFILSVSARFWCASCVKRCRAIAIQTLMFVIIFLHPTIKPTRWFFPMLFGSVAPSTDQGPSVRSYACSHLFMFVFLILYLFQQFPFFVMKPATAAANTVSQHLLDTVL